MKNENGTAAEQEYLKKSQQKTKTEETTIDCQLKCELGIITQKRVV